MQLSIYCDQNMSAKEDISMNAVVIFNVIGNLMRLDYIDTIVVDDVKYTTLYRNMILLQIPRYDISTRTLSRLLKELEDAGLIICITKNTTPSYVFTKKANNYIYSERTKEDLLAIQSKTPLPTSKRKKPLFELTKPTRVASLTPEYYQLLKTHCLDMCKNKSIPSEEFDKFIEYHGSKGSKFTNFIMAFGTWCRNYKKFNPNDGENKNGLYQ